VEEGFEGFALHRLRSGVAREHERRGLNCDAVVRKCLVGGVKKRGSSWGGLP
jgi:hypothetical protein